MFLKLCFCLIVCIDYLEPFSSAEYQYLGVKNVNQMEPPSLESVGMLEGQYQHDQENMVNSPMRRSLPSQAGSARSLASQVGNARSMGAQKDCNKPNGGWRAADPYDKPMIRSLKKPCDNNAGKGRNLDDTAVTPNIKMVDRKKEESPLQEISRIQMRAQESKAEEKDLKPNVKEKIETYTETYMVTSMATRIITRKRLFMQKRKIINQKINKPIVVIRRKVIKERQIFERIIPKIIETREIINNPIVKSKVVEGPIYEVCSDEPLIGGPGQMRSIDEVTEEDCPEVEFDPNSGDTVDGSKAVYGSHTGYGYLG